MAFGIPPRDLVLRPSTVLQNIIQEKQLAAQEKARATNERLANKRIALQEQAATEQTRQFGVSQESAQKRFDVGRTLDEREKITADIAQAQEARRVKEAEVKEAQRLGMAELFAEPTVAPVQEEWKGIPYRLPTEPVVAPKAPAYTPPADIAGYLEQFPDRKADLEAYQSNIRPLKLTIPEELILSQQTVANNLNIKDPAIMKVKIASAIRTEKKTRKTANTKLKQEIRKEQATIRDEMRTQLQPEKLKLSQKVTLAKTILANSSSTGDKILDAKLKSAGLLTGDIQWTDQQREWAKDILSSVTQTNKDKYNKLRASGVSSEDARKRLGL